MKDYFSIRLSIIFILFWIFPGILHAQRARLHGHVIDSADHPIQLATISIPEFNAGTTTDSLGFYELTLPAQVEFTFVVQHLNYEKYSTSMRLMTGEDRLHNAILSSKIR